MRVKVFAKLNLTLSVGAKQGKFHPIDSVVTSVEPYDVVDVAKRSDEDIVVNSLSGIPNEQNSAYKAAVAFQQAFCTTGVSIFVEKGIPRGAGMGGSSADAAAVVYCMCKLFGVDVHSHDVHELCASLGSDINFMLFGGLGRMRGKGDDIIYYKLRKPVYFALTQFNCQMSSGEVYAEYDKLVADNKVSIPSDGSASDIDSELLLLQLNEQDEYNRMCLSNDLIPATQIINGYADRYRAFICSQNRECNMTGSGSAYYVACASKDEAKHIKKLLKLKGFETTVCKTVSTGIVEI